MGTRGIYGFFKKTKKNLKIWKKY